MKPRGLGFISSFNKGFYRFVNDFADGENIYNLDLGLTAHENAWKRDILKSYLSYLKDLRYGVPFTLRPSHYLRLGDVICIQYNGLVIGGQIVSLAHNALDDTRVRIRTV